MTPCVLTTVTGPYKQTVAKDVAVTSQNHSGSLEPTPEPTESRSSSEQAHRTASEPIRKTSLLLELYHVSGAKLKVASDGSVDGGRIKKPKSGIEPSTSLCA